MEILTRAGELKHMALVSLIKIKYQLGHGHSNALVAHFLRAKGDEFQLGTWMTIAKS